MTREDILRMAQEADYNPRDGGVYKFDNFDLERFAALVAAAEREACAKVVEDSDTRWLGVIAAAIRARGQA